MRSVSIALMGALTLAAVGANTAAEAQGRYAPAGYRVSQPLPIRIRPRSWLDAGNVVEANNGSVGNPATNPHFITASYLNSPPYGRNDRFGGGMARCLAAIGRQVDTDRAADPVAADGPGRGAGTASREFARRERAIDVDQRHRGRHHNPQFAAGKADDPAARFLD